MLFFGKRDRGSKAASKKAASKKAASKKEHKSIKTTPSSLSPSPPSSARLAVRFEVRGKALLEAFQIPQSILVKEAFRSGLDCIEVWGGDPTAPSGGYTGGLCYRVSDAFEQQASGNRIRVTVEARTESESEPTLRIAYSTNDVGNSGWQSFTCTRQSSLFAFEYDVPVMKNGNGDFIGLLGPAEPHDSVEIFSVSVELV